MHYTKKSLVLIVSGLLLIGNISGYADPVEEKEKDKVVELDSNHSPVPTAEDPKNQLQKEDQSIREKEIVKVPIEAPASVTGEKYQGSGTVVDFTSTGSKAFYTIKARDNSVYYLIIDLDKTENNVYFLSEINGEELSLKEVTTDRKPQGIPTQMFQPNKPNNNSSSNSTFYLIVLMASVAFIAWYYTKKIKSKKSISQESMPEDEGIYYDEDFYEKE